MIFDKAYVDFEHLFDLAQAGIYWVTRAKDNLQYKVRKRLQKAGDKKILRDELIVLKTPQSRASYPAELRRVVALVEVEGKEVEMVFLTNNLIWSAAGVADLYRSRWSSEVFFKQIKQTLQRSAFLGHRAKDNLQYKVRKRLQKAGNKKILRDDLIVLKTPQSRASYPAELRRVVALVEIEGKEVEMVFLTNNLIWSAASVADLYRSRWSIEVFFKQIKQTLQLSDFLGHSANAVRWQIWTALLVYLLLRYLGFVSRWTHSFTRLFTVVRSVLWRWLDLRALLESYGTAGGSFRMLGTPQAAYLPGF